MLDAPIDLDRLEDAYCEFVSRSHRKRFAQFFTPPATAKLMAEWVAGAQPQRVLDPAVGTGVLLRAIKLKAPSAQLVGFDIDPACLEFARQSLPRQAQLSNCDYLISDSIGMFDGIIANPPYLRHHDFSYNFDIFKKFSADYFVNISKLTNAYILFTLKSLSFLKEGGRAAFLIPAEWSNANFGDALKRYFLDRNLLKKVIYFSHQDLIFDDNFSTGCILLVENNKILQKIDTFFVNIGESVEKLSDLSENRNILHQKFSIIELASTKKWDHLLANGRQDRLQGLVPLGTIAKTKRGIATGANNYFHLNESRARSSGLSECHLQPCIGKARHVTHYAFTQEDFNKLRTEDKDVWLVNFKQRLTPTDLLYVQSGETDGINERFLTRARNPWYSMEQQVPAPIWAAVFGRNEMRFILNEAGTKNLTTFHCVYPHDKRPIFVKALLACLNSTTIQSRARSKNRVYGGGLLKYEPKDLLEIEVPDLTKVSTECMVRLADLFDAAQCAAREGQDGFCAPGLEEAVEAAIAEASTSFLL